MKRGIVFSLVLLVALIFVSGCGKSEKTFVCEGSGTLTNGVSVNYKYKVNYKGKYVTKVVTEETATSSDTDVLNALKEGLDEQYEEYAKIDHYDVDIKLNNNKISSKVVIDYEKIDTSKLVEIEPTIATILDDGKLEASVLKELYKEYGFSCK